MTTKGTLIGRFSLVRFVCILCYMKGFVYSYELFCSE